MLSQRLSLLKPSPTLAVSQKSQELKASGKDVINFSVGEPDFDTPDHIKNAAKHAIDNGSTKYTPVAGIDKLKQAIVEKFQRENQLDFVLPEIIAATGAKQIIFNAFLATLDKNDEVIIPAPGWVSYFDIAGFFEAKPVVVSCPESQGFKITAEQLAASITPKTKWLVLNSPANPTGAVYTFHELESIAKVLQANPHVWILSDDIYEHLIYDDQKFFNILNVAPNLKDRTLVVNGLSKGFSMTGWRLGYAAGPQKLIKALTTLQSQSTSNPNSITQHAAIAALNEPRDFLKKWCNTFVERRDYVLERINAIEGLSAIKPMGAFYIYVNCSGVIHKKTPSGKVIQSDTDFSEYLITENLVATVSGEAFYFSPYLRISYAIDMENIVKACDRIESAVKNLK